MTGNESKMARRNVNYYLIKTARISGWLLLPLVVVYILTGFAMRGEFGLGSLLTAEEAKVIHQDFRWPLMGAFLVHAVTTVYFSLRRWGWIKKSICP